MTDAAVETPTLRDMLKAATPEEFAKAHTKTELQEFAQSLELDADVLKGTKADITAAIYDAVPLPDPALRGNSTVDSPVALVWIVCNEDLTTNGPENRTGRSKMVEALKKQGVAHFTARTQYQAWFTATDKATKPLTKDTDPDDLPRGVAKAWGLIKDSMEEAEEK